MPLSAAPAATFEALLFVVPAMAAFLAASEMGNWWTGRVWVVAVPVVALPWIEAVLSIIQFYSMRTAGGSASFVSGTYAAYDHYAGFLEMALPLAVMAALSTRNVSTRIAAAPRAASLLGVAHAC
jgi:hypothetical protein